MVSFKEEVWGFVIREVSKNTLDARVWIKKYIIGDVWFFIIILELLDSIKHIQTILISIIIHIIIHDFVDRVQRDEIIRIARAILLYLQH